MKKEKTEDEKNQHNKSQKIYYANRKDDPE